MTKYIFSVSDGVTGEYLGDIKLNTPVFPTILMVEATEDGEVIVYRKEDNNV